MELFKPPATTPLAHEVRPQSLENFYGQEHLLNQPLLKQAKLSSLILWGPPGCGKTTLAHILAKKYQYELYPFSAVLGGLAELRKTIQEILEQRRMFQKESVLFIDEIHRFNKAQQDALLPHVEKGDFIFIGATTENPRVSVNRALLSRLQTLELKLLSKDHVLSILQQALKQVQKKVSPDILNFLAEFSSGDARRALNFLELALNQGADVDLEQLKPLIQSNSRLYDKNLDRHYDVISAYIKSMRGSDPHAALLWLAVMLEGGEDPVFIARRLVIFASEDVGNADPRALSLAVSCLHTVQLIGMPEARISLAQATTYLASTLKSNAAYKAIDEALEYVRSHPSLDTPDHLKNYPPQGTKPYLYPHNYPEHFVDQNYTQETIPKFYRPTEQGQEKFLKERLEKLWNQKNSSLEEAGSTTK